MRDKRPVDELSIDELERILAIRKREARQARLQRLERRRVPILPPIDDPIQRDTLLTSIVEEQLGGGPISVPPVNQPAVDDESPHFEDELDGRHSLHRNGQSNRAAVWNRVLLGVEVLAVIGLVYLFVTLFGSLQSITQTTANIQAQFQATNDAQNIPPTATPAISISTVVLPGGHTYDAASNTARFNLDEVPAQYRDAYQKQVLDVPIVQPTQSPQGPLNISIPAIGVQSAVVTGDSWDALQRGVGYHVGSANPGQPGNMVLSAHNDVYGEIFRHLEDLKKGDKIIVTTQARKYVYVVTNSEVVDPTDVRVMDNTRKDSVQVTLITCHPYRVDTRRYVVYGILQPS